MRGWNPISPFKEVGGLIESRMGASFCLDPILGRLGIGDFSEKPIFDGTSSLGKGLHIRDANPALVLEDTDGALMSIQAGSGNKWYLKDERSQRELLRINNFDQFELDTPRLTIGDGTASRELSLLGANGLTESTVLSFYETTYQNNGLEFCYDSANNQLDIFDWTGEVKDATPLMTIDRDRDCVRFENLELMERSSDPPAPLEGNAIVWMSDGTGKGADGDVLIASTVSGITKYKLLFDYSTGTAW